jgi:general secretion pathway protein D
MRKISISALWALCILCVLCDPFLSPARAQSNDPEEWPLVRLELREAKVVDVLRLLSEVAPLNVVASEAAGQKKVSLYLQNVSPRVALETLCKTSGLWFREDPGSRTIRVLTTEEYQKDLVVFREDKIKVFTLLHPNAVATATAVEDLFGDRVILSLGVPEDVTGLQTYGAQSIVTGTTAGQTGTIAGQSASLGQTNGSSVGGSTFGGGTSTGTGATRFGSGTRSGIQGGFRQDRTRPRDRAAENLLDEKLTPDQIAELEKRLSSGKLEEEGLRGISRREPPIYVTVNAPHNLIIVRTSDEKALSAIEGLVASLDRPTPQVLLEMKILELDLQDDFSSIFDFDFNDVTAQRPGNSVAGKNNPFLATGPTSPLNVVGAGNFNLNPASTLVYQFLNDRIRARVQLLETEHRVNVLSTPLILCAHHGTARIFVGEERPLTRNFQAQNSVTQTTVSTLVVPETEIRDIGTTLQLIPEINADRTVTLTLLQESSTLNPQAAQIPVPLNNGSVQQFAVDTVNTSNLAGTIVAKDAMTIAVGGLIQDRIERTEQKIPYLSEIPVLGAIFRNTERLRKRTELVLLITPRVLFTPVEAQTVSRERLLALSIHPYQDKGDRAAQAYEKHEVPQADRTHVFIRDLLAPDPEPVK